MTETYQKFQIVEDMIWLAKAFGEVISFGSGQVAKALRAEFLLWGIKRFLLFLLPTFNHII